MGKATLIRFKDTLENNADDSFGILFEDGYVLCLCCGGTFEPGEYEIVEKFKHDEWHYVNDTLKENF